MEDNNNIKENKYFAFTKKTVIVNDDENTITNETYTLRDGSKTKKVVKESRYSNIAGNNGTSKEKIDKEVLPLSYGAQGIGFLEGANDFSSSDDDAIIEGPYSSRFTKKNEDSDSDNVNDSDQSDDYNDNEDSYGYNIQVESDASRNDSSDASSTSDSNNNDSDDALSNDTST